MASVFGHVAASTALGQAFFRRQTAWKALLLAGFCAFCPDLDVLAFRFDIPYNSIWGHRGWTHSLAFALLLGTTLAWLVYGREKQWWKMALWFVLATASHPLLDMLTTGGLGCALWWPVREERLFFPWRPILVSPLELRSFISKYGIRVLLNEFLWIGVPGLLMVWMSRIYRKASESG